MYSRYALLILAALLGFVAGFASSSDEHATAGARSLEQATDQAWTIILRGVPDAAGSGPYECQGCDGQMTGADRFAAAGQPLRAVPVSIVPGTGYEYLFDRGVRERASYPTEPSTATPGPSSTPSPTATPTEPPELWEGMLEPSAGSPILHAHAVIESPPPYIAILLEDPPGYARCPRSPRYVWIDQADFDAHRGSRPGRGRQLDLQWSFWTCPSVVVEDPDDMWVP